MSIELTLNGKAGSLRLTAQDARRDFASGSLPAWSFHIDRQDAHAHMAALADLHEAPATVQGVSADVGDLGPSMRVVGVAVDDATGALVVSAEPVPFGSPRPDTQLRRRVIPAPNAAAVLAKFGHVAALVPAAANTLQRLKFSEHSCTLQDGLSDLDQTRQLLRDLDAVQKTPELQCLMFTGRAGQVRPGWAVTWLHGAAFEKLNAMKARQVLLAGDDGQEEIAFLGWLVRRRIARPLAGWKAWALHELPLFTDKGGRVNRVVDRLYMVGDRMRWDTELHIVPDELPAVAPCAATPWAGTGVVEKVEGIWMRVRLAGFEKKDNGDLAFVRLTTPYSGTNGDSGLNFTPEPGTTVKVGWSGRLGEPLHLDLNVRDKPAALPSPSLGLDKPAEMQFESLKAKASKDVTMAAGGTMSVEATGTLEMKGDGASTKMAGGKVKSGGT